MPSANVHTRFAETAARLIDRHGRSMQLLTDSQSGDPWDPVLTQSAQDIVGVQTQYEAHEIDGELIRREDKRFLLDATVTPDTAMRLRDDGVDYSIINIDKIQPGTTSIIYKLQVRK